MIRYSADGQRASCTLAHACAACIASNAPAANDDGSPGGPPVASVVVAHAPQSSRATTSRGVARPPTPAPY